MFCWQMAIKPPGKFESAILRRSTAVGRQCRRSSVTSATLRKLLGTLNLSVIRDLASSSPQGDHAFVSLAP